MPLFSTLDLFALAWFLSAWAAYSVILTATERRKRGLNAEMDQLRDRWMLQMLGREMRMVDAQIIAALQNGTAFFASTSLIAIGGALTLMRSTEELISVVSPFGITTSRGLWEVKTIGLAVIFAYAFFKFAWSYRLYNYVSILLGAMPFSADKETPEALAHIRRTALLFQSAGRHFNRGQRAFFFALGYLGWFISPWLLMITSVAVAVVLWRRQFASDSRHAVVSEDTAAPRAPS